MKLLQTAEDFRLPSLCLIDSQTKKNKIKYNDTVITFDIETTSYSFMKLGSEYKQIVKFLKSETSTVSGMEAATQNMAESFEARFDIRGLNKRQLNRLYKTLSSGQWRDIQEAYGQVSSEEIIDSLIKGIRDGMTIRDLKNVLSSIERDMGDESLDWSDFDRRFTKYYAQSYEYF